MGRIGEPKREIHIPVPPPARRPSQEPEPVADAAPDAGRRRPSRSAPDGGAVSLPWDVYATPIAARKLARLGVEQDRVVLRPAFYRQLGEAYGAVAHATCALADHDAPAADCSCGFYAVADDTQLWRLGADEPELAVLDVELAGRVIEHDHGYRASDQRVHRTCASTACACAAASGPRRSRTAASAASCPSCRRCARRAVEADDGVGVARGAGVVQHRRPRARAAGHAAAVRARADGGAGADPARHRRRRARHRLGRPARVRAARHRRVAGHGARRCSRASANASASAAPKRSGSNIAGVRSSPRSRSGATSCSPSS